MRLDEPDLEAALKDFEMAVQMEPDNVKGRYLLGRTFLDIGKHDISIEHLDLGKRVWYTYRRTRSSYDVYTGL